MGRNRSRKQSPPAEEPNHPLLEPRLLATVGLVGLGGGLGIGLMLAKTLILTGLVLSLGSALAVLWIYARPFGDAYSALANKKIYSGPSVKELAVALIIVAAVVPISVILYVGASQTEAWKNRALIQYAGAAPVETDDANRTLFYVSLTNEGDREAKAVASAIRGRYVEGSPLSQSEADKIMKELLEQLKKEYRTRSKSILLPTKGVTYTLPNISLQEKQLEKVENSSAGLWVFLVSIYQDDLIEDTNSWWVSESCGYLTRELKFLHQCDGRHNRVYQMTGLQSR